MKSCFNHIHDALLQFLLVLTQSLQITRFYGRKSEFRNVLVIMFRCVCVLPSPRSYIGKAVNHCFCCLNDPHTSTGCIWPCLCGVEKEHHRNAHWLDRGRISEWALQHSFFSLTCLTHSSLCCQCEQAKNPFNACVYFLPVAVHWYTMIPLCTLSVEWLSCVHYIRM